MSARLLAQFASAVGLAAPVVFVALAGSCGPVSPERPPAATAIQSSDSKSNIGDEEPAHTTSDPKAPDGAAAGEMKDGFFVVDGAPDPRACEASSDCVGDTIPDASGCCQDPRRVVPHALRYKAFIAKWRKTACADVTCPAPPPPSLPARCLFETRCIDQVCTDTGRRH